jgi:hypothetical protein
MYRTELKQDEDSLYDFRMVMKITDDSGTREYWDRGEPEDNTFYRDWSWIQGELEKAYQQGRKDEAADRI